MSLPVYDLVMFEYHWCLGLDGVGAVVSTSKEGRSVAALEGC